jgi:hypothetical protein
MAVKNQNLIPDPLKLFFPKNHISVLSTPIKILVNDVQQKSEFSPRHLKFLNSHY